MRNLSYCFAMGLLALAGCRPGPQVTSHGVGVISVNPAFSEAVNRAMVEVHNELANWIVEGDNKKSDPTYKAGSRTWKEGTGTEVKKDAKIHCSRSYIEFRTNKDIHVRIETVFVGDQTLLVLLNCDNQDETIRVHNMVIQKIQSQCGGKK